MRFGTLINAAQLAQATRFLEMGFEFLEIVAPHQPQTLVVPSLPPVPLIWQCPAELPSESPNLHLQQAVLASWREHLQVAHQFKAVLLVVQFRRPAVLTDKTRFIEQYRRLLEPLTTEARALGVQVVLRNSPDNRDQLQLLREILRGVAGLGLAVDVAYTQQQVVKNLTPEYLWDSDLLPRLAHLYVSDTTGQDAALRLPLGTTGLPDWERLVRTIKERYNASVTLDAGQAHFDYWAMSRHKWLTWWS